MPAKRDERSAKTGRFVPTGTEKTKANETVMETRQPKKKK
jgi:hypothetical protein